MQKHDQKQIFRDIRLNLNNPECASMYYQEINLKIGFLRNLGFIGKSLSTASFTKPYRNPVYKCTDGSR